MIITCWDTETTGLVNNHVMPLDKQPELTEAYFCTVNLETGEILAEWESLFKPSQPISDEITRITGIDDALVADAPAFKDKADEIAAFIEGSPIVCAHNLSFDKEILDLEAERLGRTIKWPPLLCSVEASVHLLGYRLTLTALHEHLFNARFPEAHRARNDVQALVRCMCELYRRGEL